jgi:hypothetical protein
MESCATSLQYVRLFASGQGVEVIGSEHSQPVGKERLDRGCGTGRVPGSPSPVCEVGSGGQGVRVVVAEHSQPVGEQGLACGNRAGSIARFSQPAG